MESCSSDFQDFNRQNRFSERRASIRNRKGDVDTRRAYAARSLGLHRATIVRWNPAIVRVVLRSTLNRNWHL